MIMAAWGDLAWGAFPWGGTLTDYALTAGNFSIAYDLLDYTPSCADADPNYPAVNLKAYESPVWMLQAASAGQPEIILDFGATKSFDKLFLGNTNAQWAIYYSSPDNITYTTLYKLPIPLDERVNRRKGIIPTIGFSGRYMKIKLCRDGLAAAAIIYLSKIAIPQTIVEFEINPGFDYKYGLKEYYLKNEYAAGGQERASLNDLKQYITSFMFSNYMKTLESHHFKIATENGQVLPALFWENFPEGGADGSKAYLVFISKDAEITWTSPKLVKSHDYLLEEII